MEPVKSKVGLRYDTRGLRPVLWRVFRILAIVLAVDIFVGIHFHPIRLPPYPVRVLQFWRSDPLPNIFVLGSSRPRENIDADYLNGRLRELGRSERLTNLAFGGGGTVRVVRQFETHIRPRLKQAGVSPGLVIIDLAEFEIHRDFYNPRQEANFDNVENWAPRYEDLQGFGLAKDTLRHGLDVYQRTYLDAVFEPLLNRSGLYRFGGDWSKKEEARKATRRLIFFWKKGGDQFVRPPPQAHDFLNPYDVGDTQIAALAELVRSIRDAGGTPILTTMPVASWRETFCAPDLNEKFNRALTDFSQSHGVTYVSISKEDVDLDDDSYFDDVHLKRENRAVLSESILQKVILPALQARGAGTQP